MELFKVKHREEYFRVQIERSKSKFSYCKVSIRDTSRYAAILQEYFLQSGSDIGPIACMGTRNGREVDMFRIAFNAPYLWARSVEMLELQRPYPHSLLPCVECYPPRSDYKIIDDLSVVGVEINPQGHREDVLISSFDDLPGEWTNRFGILFSNSFDHSMDPERTAREWSRVLRPGGVLIILWYDTEVTETDLVGDISEQYLCNLFKGCELIRNVSKSVCGYNELFLARKD